jgi:glycerophosphoryl diester phosphodiesterase
MFIKLTERLVDSVFASIPRQTPSISVIKNMQLTAHRGAHDISKGIYENTIPAFHRAREFGCWGIEFDVHVTADGVFVVNHDPTLDRLWNHNVAIVDLSFAELRALAPNIPTVAEVVAEFAKDMHLFIELKTPIHNEHRLFELLSSRTPAKDYHLITLKASLFENLSLWPKQSLLLVALHNNVKSVCALSLTEHYGGVLGSYVLLTNQVRNQLKGHEQLSGVGFVNSKNGLYRELNRGVSLIFTNQAEKLCLHLNKLRTGLTKNPQSLR